MVTVFIFLLIAFRIYYGFVTDFTISMPDTIGLKFVLLAGFYTIGSLLLYVKNYSVKATSVLFAVAMIYTGFLLIKEIHFEAFERFQKENPDCIALDNFESAKIKHLIDESYERMDNGQDLGMISGSKIVDGRLHKFTIADGSAKNIPPLFSVSALNDDSVSMKVLFRYDPVFRYGYLKYEVEGEVSLHKDSAFQLVQSLLEDLQ